MQCTGFSREVQASAPIEVCESEIVPQFLKLSETSIQINESFKGVTLQKVLQIYLEKMLPSANK